MTDKSPTPLPQKTLNRNVPLLRRRFRRLARVRGARLTRDIGDFIDLRGFAMPVLLTDLHRLPVEVQRVVAGVLEDYFFFHPDRGIRHFPRLLACATQLDASVRRHLIPAIADVAARGGTRLAGTERLGDAARVLLEAADTDLLRQAKAIEVLAGTDDPSHLPAVLAALARATDAIDSYEGFSLAETALFAVKRLGGEATLCLLINAESSAARQLLRLHFGEQRTATIVAPVLAALSRFDENRAQLLLKFIELAEYPTPFFAMVQEGLNHSSKWIRQTASATAARLGKSIELTRLFELLEDPAPEVRLMAASSLGHIDRPEVVTRLTAMAQAPHETREIRLNALYSLHQLRKEEALAELAASPIPEVARPALGLASLLKERKQGLTELLAALPDADDRAVADLIHYVAEMARADDLPRLLAASDGLAPSGRLVFTEFLGRFLHTHAGPLLDKTLAGLPSTQRSALEPLLPRRGPLTPVPGHEV